MKHEKQRVIIPGVEAGKVLDTGFGMKKTVMYKAVYVIGNNLYLCCKKYRCFLKEKLEMVAKIYMEKNNMAYLVEDKKVMVVLMSMYKVQVPREVKIFPDMPNQSQAKKSQEIMRCSFIVHLKVFEDSQEKTWAVPPHSG